MSIKHTYHQEGRTMIELIAVVCIMSILAVGTIAMYKYIMDTIKANALYDDIRLKAALNSERKASHVDWGDTTTYGDQELQLLKNNPLLGYNTVKTYNVPKSICNRLLKKDWSGKDVSEKINTVLAAERIYVNDAPYSLSHNNTQKECTKSENTFAVVFKSSRATDLYQLPKLCNTIYDCLDAEWCGGKGECVCNGDNFYYVDLVSRTRACVKDNCKEFNEGRADSVCHPGIYNPATRRSECKQNNPGWATIGTQCGSNDISACVRGKCVDFTKPNENQFIDLTGNTVDCDLKGAKWVFKKAIAHCLDRSFVEKENPSYGEGVSGVWAYGESVGPCEDNQFRNYGDNNGQCTLCDTSSGITTTEAQCNKCINKGYSRYYNGTQCMPPCNNSNQTRNSSGVCTNCDVNDAFTTTKAFCDLCPGRYYNATQHKCYRPLKENEARDISGNPFECTTTQAPTTDEANCKICTDAGFDRYYNGTQCHGPCSNLRAQDGRCYACNHQYAVQMNNDGEQACMTCGRYWAGNICYPACVAGASFRISNNNCQPCNYQYSAEATEQECNKCITGITDRTKLRWYNTNNGKCEPPCYGDSTDPKFRGSNGTCYSCTESTKVSASQAECDRCTDRDYKNGECTIHEEDPVFYDKAGTSWLCSYKGSEYVKNTTEEQCLSCIEKGYARYWVSTRDNGACFPECDEDEFRETQGFCRKCNASRDYTATQTECTRCARLYNKTKDVDYSTAHTYLRWFSGLDLSTLTENETAITCKASCTDSNYLKLAGGCNGCTANNSDAAFNDEECRSCDNRFPYNGRCYKKCDPGYYFSTGDGACRICTTTNGGNTRKTTQEFCDACGTTRFYYNNQCYLACEAGVSYFSINQGKCIECTSTTGDGNALTTTEEFCKNCPERYMDGNKCKLR